VTHSPLRPDDLPETIPVFPLAGALLLPHGRLPLNIFEPRYLAMVEDALAAGRVLGMMQGDASRPRGDRRR
jgi:Lon protease-like protein